jgi:BirA family biotin operon repressor/biotin-[acetyl-CoA-carboxylase] ligase
LRELKRFLPSGAENIIVFQTIDSTNDEAKRIIAAARGHAEIPFGTVVVAEQQTAGRGRRGRGFASPAADSVYVSFILPPPPEPQAPIQPFLLTGLAAVAVCEAIEEFCGPRQMPGELPQIPGIKWVNDVLIDGRKVCGILTEAVSDAGTGAIKSYVLGIGVNINVPAGDFPEDVRGIAGAVRLRPADRIPFAATLIARIQSGHARALQGESPINAYRKRSLMPGKPITVLGPNQESRTATAKEILEDGSLLVEYADGRTEAVRNGEVSIRL